MEPQQLVLRERAEDYTASELVRIPIENTSLVRKLEFYIFEDAERMPLYLLGHPGYGKTFLTMRALNKGVTERPDFLPLMFIYKRKGDIEILEPERLAPEEAWGDRISSYEGRDRNELMEAANHIVVDDVHWACRAIIEGRYDAEPFIDLLEQAAVEAEKGKKVLLLSDGLLSFYSEKINNPRLDRLLPKFGSFRPDKVHDLGYEYMESVNSSAFYEIDPFPLGRLWNMARELGYIVDDRIFDALYGAAPRPRAIIKFLNIFMSKAEKSEEHHLPKIGFRTVIQETLQRLESERKPKTEIYSILLRMPEVNITNFGLPETRGGLRRAKLNNWKSNLDFELALSSYNMIKRKIIPQIPFLISEKKIKAMMDELVANTPKYYSPVEGRLGEARLNGDVLEDVIWHAFSVSLRED